MFLELVKLIFQAIATFFGCFASSRKKRDQVNAIKEKYRQQSQGLLSQTQEGVDTDPVRIDMHSRPLMSHHGYLRFKIRYLRDRNLLEVTILDATNLPPMDRGRCDPWVELILRPNEEKHATIYKSNSVNPTFNETFDFRLANKDLRGTLFPSRSISINFTTHLS